MKTLVLSTIVSAPFAFFVFRAQTVPALLLGIALWGVGMGAQESILKAAVTSMVPKTSRATGYGIFECSFGIFWFLGSWILGVLCSLSFGPLKDLHGFGMTVFDACDHLTSDFLMTFGSLLFVFFVGWKMKKADVRDEFTNGGSQRFNGRVFGVVYFFIRYVAPAAIIAIFLSNLLI